MPFCCIRFLSEITNDRNIIEQRVDYLVLYDGKTEEEALSIAVKENLQSLGEDVLIGSLTGAGMAGGRVAPVAAQRGIEKAQTQRDVLDNYIKDEKSLSALISSAKESGKGTKSFDVAEKVEKAQNEGTLTKSQVNKLIKATDKQIKVEEKADPLYQAAKEMVNNRSGKATPVKVNDVKKATGFGDSGSVLISKLVNDQGVSFEQAKASVETAYRAGLSGLKNNQVNLRSQIQKLAFEAGKDDKAVQDRAKIEKSKTASVYSTGFTENEYSAKLTPSEREMFTTLSGDFKMDSKMADKIVAYYVNGKAREANASHKDGKMEVSSTSGLPMVAVGLHEGFHRMRQLDPEGTDALMNFLYETSEQNARRMSLGDTGVSLFDQIKAEYGNVKGMEAIDYIEEIAAKRSETIFSSAEAYNEWRAKLETNPKAKSAWQKFLQIIKEILEDMWASITNSKMSLEAKRQAQRELELFEDAYRNAMKAADQRMQEVETTTDTKNGAVAREPKSHREALIAERKAQIEKAKDGFGRDADENSYRGLENEANEDYNKDIRYSLRDEVIFSSRYNKLVQSQTMRELYDSAKKGDLESAFNLISQLLSEEDISKVRGLGKDVYLLPVVGADGTSTNVLPKNIAEYISIATGQDVFSGIYKEQTSNSRSKGIWQRMKENYPSFTLDENEHLNISDINGQKFVLIDDNSSTGRTFVGLKNFIEENGGTVVGYYALTTGQDQSEKMVTTDETWNKLLDLGLDEVKAFAEKEGIKRERSKEGLTERESQELFKQFRRKKADSGRGKKDVARSGRSRQEIQTIRDTEKKDGSTEQSDGIDYSLKEEEDSSNVNYSLKWHTDLSRTQIKQVMSWLREAGSPESTKITNTANWYKGRIGGQPLFVIYSTIYGDDPTIMYEVRGAKALDELDILFKAMEVMESERSSVEKSRIVNELLEGNWVQQKYNLANNNAGLGGRGSNSGYASVLQGKSSKFIGSQAFRNVVKNLFDIQEKADELSRSKSHSLKDSVDVSPKKTTEYLDAVEDVQKGKKGAAERLAKYVDEGMIRTEDYEQLVEKYGAIPKGEKPHRDVEVPTKTADDKKVSQTVRTILEAKATPDELVPTVEKMVEDGVFSYDVYTDKEAIEKARDKLKNEGWIEAYNSWMKKVEQGVVSKELTAQGWALYNNAANRAAEATDETAKRDATQTALSILDAMVRHQRNAAQALQATRILKKLSPETQLYGIQKSVSAFQKELKEKYGKKAPDLKIDEELAEQFIKAKTEEERTKVEKEIFKDIGRQMPSTFMDKWNAWRYLAMLGNPRTHVRNIVGNAFFAPVVITKDLTATAIESVVHRVSGKKMLRGKSIIWGSKADRALLKAAWSDYANVADIVSNGGKYSDFAMKNQYIEEGRKIFKSKLFAPVEWARKANSKLLEREDVWFSIICTFNGNCLTQI